MDELRIKGLRSLADTGSIRIAPITVLVGENSSGKSTFLRTFPLLRQSVEVRTSEPLLWYGRLVDFGSFDESVSSFLAHKKVEVEVSIPLDPNSRSRPQLGQTGTSPCNVAISVVGGPRHSASSGEKRIESYVSHLALTIWDIKIECTFSGPTELARVVIDGEDLTATAKATYGVVQGYSPAPTLYSTHQLEFLTEQLSDQPDGEHGPKPATFSQLLHGHARNLVHNRTAEDSVDELTQTIRLGSAASMLEAVKTSQAQRGFWRKQVAMWSETTGDFLKLRHLLWGARLEAVLDALSDSMRREFLSISYITPLRAAAERYYRQQGLAVNELDAKGENFALFLRSLSSDERESLRAWLSTTLGVYVQLTDSKGHVSIYLVDSESKSRVNLADTGFGYSQLLPIAVQLWFTQERRSSSQMLRRGKLPLVVIEQPELHLHPRIQAKVADVLAQIASTRDGPSKAHIVVETHSEALVNRLGRLIANGTLMAADVNIVLFNKQSFDAPTSVSSTTFDSNGYLQDWPLGFFNSES